MQRPRSFPIVPQLLACQLLACQLLVPAHAMAQTAPAAPAPPPAAPKVAEPKPAEKPPEPKPAEPKPAEPKPAEPKPAEPKPAEKPPEPKPAEAKPAEPTPADAGTAAATTPSPEVSAEAPNTYPVQVVSPILGLQLQVYPIELDDVTRGPTRDSDKFRDACVAPCRTSLTPGAYQLSVKTPDGQRTTTSTGLLLAGPATVDIDIISHADTRRAGWYWALVGSAAGALATGVGLLQDCGPDHQCARTAALGIWGGITVMSVSWLIGIPKITTADEATISIRPGISGGPAAARSLAPSEVGTHTSKLAGAF